MLSNWKQTPWGHRYDVVQDEFPVDGGLTSRRIDILARNRASGDRLIIELKRAEANIAAVHQVSEHLLALGKRDDFAHGRLDGVLVAERISPAVRECAANEGVSAYEANWPFEFIQVT
ncbi:endonuclease NucS domain-containing protein [Paramylibacter kogurei]|uniref:endonuclease NucS domain-containing protein n=1 Tax=Paramylibacter kogurei TaxID=1889778 RepID=UPI000C15DA16